MKIIVDAMGGDNAPGAIVQGALEAKRTHGLEILLVGRTEEILRAVEACGEKTLPAGVEIKGATEVVEIADDPATAFKVKKDSSLTVGLNLLKEGAGDAFVSAGSTGALLSGATLVTKRIRGIRRAAMGPTIPVLGGRAILCDCGANAECTPEYLLQFAYLGSFYAQRVQGVERPRVGLLNIGAEAEKGDDLRHETYPLLQAAAEQGRLNFIGNVEANDVMLGKADVVVTDGFTGNIMLKTAEGTIKFLMKNIKGCLTASFSREARRAAREEKPWKAQENDGRQRVGGTAFLGIQRPVIKAHGSSDARAVRSAVKQAIAFVQSGFTAEIENNIAYMRLRGEEQDK